MSLISVENLTFAYDGSYDNIFENLSVQMDTDWRLGFVGRNGRGKTTFLRLLCGQYEYSGRISGGAEFEYFPYEVTDMTQHTAEVVGGICGEYEPWELARELSLLAVDEEVLARPFETLSNGERTKVLLAALFLKENRFLLIDEPTNHLDMDARALVSEYLRGKRGFILVSHDRAFLDHCVDHVLALNKAGIEVQRGNFSSWFANKERQDRFELAENDKLKKDIKKLKQAARQSGDWADKVEGTKIGQGSAGDNRAYVGEKSRRMQQRRKNLERRQGAAIEEKSSLLQNIEHAESLKIPHLTYHTSRLAALSDVSVYYGERAVCEGVNLTIEQGDRVALRGRNGSGKSSLLKLICGEAISHTGEVSVASQLVISHVPQDASFLSGDLSGFAAACGIDESLFKAILRKLDFSRVQFEKDMRDFSGGQKKKVLIAKSLCERAHLYVWDEPLNFIDVYSRMQIEELLLEHRPTVLFVEHDSAFCENIATKTIDLSANPMIY